MSLFLYLVIKKYINSQIRQKINGLKEFYRLDMFHYLQASEQWLLEVEQDQETVKALIELLSEYSNVLEGTEVTERISIFAKQYLTNYIKKQLRKKRWSLRMNALYSIEDFYMKHLVDILHELFNKKRTTAAEKTQIVKLLAKFNDHKIIEYVKKVNPNVSDFSLLTILLNMDEDQFDQLVASFNELPTRIQYMVIDTIGKKQLIQHHSLLHELVMGDEVELKVRSLKAYANTGIPIDVKVVAAFFESDNWQIRMMAIKVAGVQRMDEYKEKLIERLSDPEYVVRAESAKAILRFKDGVSTLTNISERSNDMFASDMAIEWLEKERGGYTY
jgi:tRNA (Thr-GGU) A37 N-methylase